MLTISNLHAGIQGKEILRGLNLEVKLGELHVLMGPNGSGKSTFASTLMGHPSYTVSKGAIEFAQNDILALAPEKRAKLGLFMQFQNPPAVPGVSLGSLVRRARMAMDPTIQSDTKTIMKFRDEIKQKVDELKLDDHFVDRSIHDGFSGGEKKRAEILQLALLPFKLAILDEPDSGLDVDGLRLIAQEVNKLMNKDRSIILITHYQRILKYLKPTHVHVMLEGKIVRSGGPELVGEIEEKGYEWLKEEELKKN
ncbi:MAG TPA: Fe-S cluster assembly ATPase SufC [Patescibacteria group bacterium]|nr:Fe-S cluster assembly ATPase SufC [Patescibacteria group bacterium]